MDLGRKPMFVARFVFQLAQAEARSKCHKFQCRGGKGPWNADGSDRLLTARESGTGCGIRSNAQRKGSVLDIRSQHLEIDQTNIYHVPLTGQEGAKNADKDIHTGLGGSDFGGGADLG